MKKLLTLAALAFVAGCATQNETSAPLSLTATSFDALAGWNREDFSSLLPVLRQNCHRVMQLPPETPLGGADELPYGREAGNWSAACAALETTTDARSYVQTWFQPYAVDGGAFYTGYFEPQIEASLTRGGPYQTPVYERPKDLVRTKATNGQMVTGRWDNGQFKPYYDRAQIDQGALDGQGLEIAWLKSPVDLFFLQIQGS
ncbi:murein transglycosylase, partial [Gluconobacter japonicus]